MAYDINEILNAAVSVRAFDQYTGSERVITVRYRQVLRSPANLHKDDVVNVLCQLVNLLLEDKEEKI